MGMNAEIMKMNLLVVIFIVLMIWRAYRGFKSGFAKEISGVVSLFMALVVLSVVFLLVAGIWEKNIRTTVASVVMLLIVSFLCWLLNMVMKSIETLAKLPLISLVNRLLGIVAGALEIMIVFWIMYVIIEGVPTGRFGEQIMTWTKQSTLLVNIYNKNYIANWIVGLKL